VDKIIITTTTTKEVMGTQGGTNEMIVEDRFAISVERQDTSRRRVGANQVKRV
jgi:hypothetical protein